MMEIAKIGVEKVGGKLKVVSESLWDEKQERDFPGVLEGILDEVYDDEEEIRDAIEQILSDNDVDYSVVQVDIHYITGETQE